jgi:hypothetical protein
MGLRWTCVVAIFTALSSQAIAEEQSKPRFLARASCTVVRYCAPRDQDHRERSALDLVAGERLEENSETRFDLRPSGDQCNRCGG